MACLTYNADRVLFGLSLLLAIVFCSLSLGLPFFSDPEKIYVGETISKLAHVNGYYRSAGCFKLFGYSDDCTKFDIDSTTASYSPFDQYDVYESNGRYYYSYVSGFGGYGCENQGAMAMAVLFIYLVTFALFGLLLLFTLFSCCCCCDPPRSPSCCGCACCFCECTLAVFSFLPALGLTLCTVLLLMIHSTSPCDRVENVIKKYIFDSGFFCMMGGTLMGWVAFGLATGAATQRDSRADDEEAVPLPGGEEVACCSNNPLEVATTWETKTQPENLHPPEGFDVQELEPERPCPPSAL